MFDGWYLGETPVTDADTVPGDVTLSARWKPWAYTVIFDVNRGEGSMDGLECLYGTAYPLPECAFTRTGYGGFGPAAEPLTPSARKR